MTCHLLWLHSIELFSNYEYYIEKFVTGIDGGFFKLYHIFLKEMGKTSNHLRVVLASGLNF
jgi:hypothetical protein